MTGSAVDTGGQKEGWCVRWVDGVSGVGANTGCKVARALSRVSSTTATGQQRVTDCTRASASTFTLPHILAATHHSRASERQQDTSVLRPETNGCSPRASGMEVKVCHPARVHQDTSPYPSQPAELSRVRVVVWWRWGGREGGAFGEREPWQL